ncbi:MAG TPA: aldehyde dehydrogenase family protein [Gemmatimonadales bacterium]|jgi:glyceraldehyde-3-phosphate dehydrogenase (NADP+)|nr:aldehyde dehydrogenase family protein [Gemmatimonadales bacterium]
MSTREQQTSGSERETAVIRAPHDGSEVGVVALAGPAEVRAALDANVAASRSCRDMPAYERAAALRKVADGLAAERKDLARTLALEAGKPIAQARLELDRAVFVFNDAAEEATRIGGDVLPADVLPVGAGRIALTRRFPLSPIAGITPFNFPVLLAAHKIAPAMACGATLTLKPPPQDPLTTLRLAELVQASGYPAGGVNVVPCHVEVAQILIEDPRVRLITFTGSAKAGWAIRAKAGTKRVALELGGNAAVIVEPDADLGWAAARCAVGGFTYAGQSCISTQRIYVHESVYTPFLDAFVPRVRQLKVGDVLDDKTDVGPMISLDAAERVERWIGEAVGGGAKIAVGGKRSGVFLEPTVLLHTTPEMKVNCEEVFAPLVTVTPYRKLDDAIAAANASPYGLQAGAFTTNLQTMFRLHAELDVGAVNGNDIPGFRVDRLPYGGAKASGLGREGVRYAIEEMTELRLLTFKLD